MPRKASLDNLAASITGATVALSKTDANTAVITFTTLDVHNLYPGAKVITTGLSSTDGNFNPNLVSQLVYKIDSPTAFSANVPWTYTTVPTISLTGGSGVYGSMYSSNGALNAISPKYGLPVTIPRPRFYNYTYPTLTAVGWGTGVKLNWAAIGIANPAVDLVTVERLVNGSVVATLSTSATGVNVMDTSLASTGVANPFTYRVTARNTVQSNIISEVVDTLWLGSLGTATAAATSGISSSITISWPTPTSGNASITNLELERATNSGFTVGATTISTALSASATSYTDTTVATSSSYYYRVRSRGDYASATSVYSVYSTTGSATSPYYITAPASVTVSPTASTANQLSVSWGAVSTASPNISSYTLQEAYSTDGGTSFSAWETAASTAGTTYTKVSATSGYQYKYRVQALNGQLVSAYTTSTATAPYYLADPLTAPGVTNAASNNSNLVISGSYNANPSTLTFNIRRSSNGGSTWSDIGATNFPHTLPVTDTTTASGVSYIYSVKAKNTQLTNLNWSANSISVGAYSVPNPPTTVSAAQTPGTTNINVSWSGATVIGSSPAITSYLVETSSTGNSSWSTVVTTSASSIVATGSSTAVATYYRISAINSVGTGTASAVTQASFVNSVTPTASATASTANSISVSWSAPTSFPTLSNYVLQEATSTDNTTFGAWATVQSSTATSYVKTAATNNIYYRYQVAAITSAQTGAYGTASSGVQPYYLADPLTAPEVTNSSTSTTSITVTGTYTANPAISGYNIQRAVAGASPTFASVGPTNFSITLPYVDTSVSANTSYLYQVKAKNAQLTTANWSANSVSKLTYNVPTFPTGVNATAAAYNTINLSWTAGTVNSTATPIIDYKIERATNTSFAGATTLSTTVTALTYSDSTASELTTYYYRVSARNAIGYSPVSSYATATTPAQAINTTTTVNAISSVVYPTGATVSGSVSPNPAGGTITISESGSFRASGTVSISGTYSIGIPTASAGAHNLSLSYSGIGIYQSSTATTSYTVNAASSSISIAGPTSTYYTDTQTFTATVSPAISGRAVKFYKAGSEVASRTTNSSGIATYSVVTSTTESSISWTASVTADNWTSATSTAKVSSVVAMPLYINATISGATDNGFYVGTGANATIKAIAMSATATDQNGDAVAITPTYKYKQFGGSPTTWSGASTSRNQSTLFYATATKAGYVVQDQSGYGNGSNTLTVFIAQEQTAAASDLGDYAGPSGTVFGNNDRYSTTSLHQGYFSSNQGDYQSVAWFATLNWPSLYQSMSPTTNSGDGIIAARLTLDRLAGVGDSAARALWIGAHADTDASPPASYTSISPKSINLDKTHTMSAGTTATKTLNLAIRQYWWDNAETNGGVTFGRQGVSSVQSGANNIYMELDNLSLEVVWYADPAL